MFKLVAVGLGIWALLSPTKGAIAFVIFLVLYQGWWFLGTRPQKNLLLPKKWSDAEAEVIRKYKGYVSFPFSARNASATLSLVQFLGIIVAIVLAIRGNYWAPAPLIANYFIAGALAFRLNPLFFLQRKVDGWEPTNPKEWIAKLEIEGELDALQAVMEKLYKNEAWVYEPGKPIQRTAEAKTRSHKKQS
jgi:hypothetical protein